MTTNRQEVLQNRLGPEIQELKAQCKTVMLATVGEDGNPNVSYAPFAINNGEYQVFISTIARHARNLQEVPKVSLMLIEDESQSRQILLVVVYLLMRLRVLSREKVKNGILVLRHSKQDMVH